ncbi:hypothetical protein MBLNU457_3399t1 [Dothideomycetes sp. NU457]
MSIDNRRLSQVESREQRYDYRGRTSSAITSTRSRTSHTSSLAPQNIVIPANLLPTAFAPYDLQGESNEQEEPQQPFDVQAIAHQQHEEIRSSFARPASFALGNDDQARTIGLLGPRGVPEKNDLLRKTSLNSRQEARLSRLHGGAGTTAYDLRPLPSLREEGQPKPDYFGNVVWDRDGAVGGATGAQDFAAGAGQITAHFDESPGEMRRQSTRQSRERQQSVIQRAGSVVGEVLQNVADAVRRSSLADLYEKAKVRRKQMQRKKWVQLLFEYTFYLIIVAFVYFVLIGVPLWNGTVWWLWWVFSNRFVVPGTWAVTIAVATFYAYGPLLVFFEKDPPMPDIADIEKGAGAPGTENTALLIPCYKSEKIIGPTLEAALKIFPASHIFVLANGNSPTPLDKTEDVCNQYGVNHIWSPVGSKIVAQFVGTYAAKDFKNALLIDDDCALPPDFPIVSDRMRSNIKCIGYTIKSVGPNGTRGTLCQQAQDLEYKLSGIQRAFFGKIGSATFPHGAISLWDVEFLKETFFHHPGFSVSEDWFFGHVARMLGSRITMCTSVFIETETPSAVFFSSGGARGGFGEMTIFKQRFMRWNFFFVNGIYYNFVQYILFSWKLGFWEIGAKLAVFQEVYETLLYLLTPFVVPISIVVRPAFFGYLFAGTFGIYFLNALIFNELHLRIKSKGKERVHSLCTYVYYPLYKIVLTFVNVASCYYSIWKYSVYFAKRHPKIIEDERAVNVVLRMEESAASPATNGGRRMTITNIGTQVAGLVSAPDGSARRATITTLGPRLSHIDSSLSPLAEIPEPKPVHQRRQRADSVGESLQDPSPMTDIPVPAQLSPRALTHSAPPSNPVSPSAPAIPPLQFRSLTQTSLSSNLRPTIARAPSSRSRTSHDRDRDLLPPRRSSSLRRMRSNDSSHSGSSGGGAVNRNSRADFEAPGYEELMNRLAIIDSRLEARNSRIVDVVVEEGRRWGEGGLEEEGTGEMGRGGGYDL